MEDGFFSLLKRFEYAHETSNTIPFEAQVANIIQVHMFDEVIEVIVGSVGQT